MTEDEALQMARAAVQEAVRRHGNQRQSLIAALEQEASENPDLMEAFAISGYLVDQSQAADKH